MNNRSKYTSLITVDSQYKETMERLYSKYGEQMMALEGLSTSDLDTCYFFKKFLETETVADATIDDNANVSNKNIQTMLVESMKPYKKMLSRNKLYIEMKESFGKDVADKFLEEAVSGGLYEHDSHLSSYMPYCFAFSLENIVNNGLYFISEMKASKPKHWDTFNHHVLEFISYATNMMAGAIGIPDYLVYAYYFYMEDTKDMSDHDRDRYRNQKFQELIYNLNQPYLKAATQSAYTNFSILDIDHIARFFVDKKYPDGTLILSHIDGIQQFQQYFLDYIGELRKEKWHTFPVISASLLFKDGDFVDKETARMVIEHNHKFGFNDVNIMPTEEVTSAASCCRLVSNIKDLRGATFNSIGGSDLNVGSTKVVTLNLARYGLESIKDYQDINLKEMYNGKDHVLTEPEKFLFNRVRDQVRLCHKYHYAHRNALKKLIDKGVLPLYTYNMMSLDDQFATIGINGLYECVYAMGGIDNIDGVGVKYNEYGYYLAENIFKIINEENEKTMELYGYMSNVEQVPAESAAIKLNEKDRIYFGNLYVDNILGKDSYIYANQWIPLKENASVFDRIDAATKLDKFCGGGAILHINLGEQFRSVDDAYEFTRKMAERGVKYFSYISIISICDKDHSFFGDKCPICGGHKTDEGIKVVGYLVKSKNYKKERKTEFSQRKFYSINNL